MSNELKKCGVMKDANVSYAASTAVKDAALGAQNVNSAMSTIDALRQQLADVSNERDGLRAASVEMLRIAGIANQGSNAYNRAIEHLHNAVQSTEQKAQS